jgi:cytochrome c biogenesis protein CcmG/thiol:disulfide interchange protein DsbE
LPTRAATCIVQAVTTDDRVSAPRGGRAMVLVRRVVPWLALGAFALWSTRGFEPAAHFGVGGHLPEFSAVLTDGSTFSTSEQPRRVTVLNFWASYCEPCRAEAPLFSDAQAAGVRVVGLSTEPFTQAEVERRARALGMQYPVGVATPALMSRFGVQALPTTYVVAPDGVVVLSRVGGLARSELDSALARARKHGH